MGKERERLLIVLTVLLNVSVVVSLLVLDWVWAIVAAMGIVVLAVPMLIKKELYTYHTTLLIIAAIPFSLYLILFAANILVGIDYNYYRFISLTIQPLACMIIAYMVFVTVDVNSEMVISKRWLFAFSVAFTCVFAVMSIFFVYVAMKDMDFLLTNADYLADIDADNTSANRYIMLPINLAVVLSLFYGLMIDRSLKKVEAKELTQYFPGVEE